MKLINTTFIHLLLASALFGVGFNAVAETADANVGETIQHIKKALVEIGNSDFNAAQVQLKAARASAEKIASHEDIVKQANALVIQGQIKSKKGEIQNASDELNKALALYKSL